MYLQTVKIFVIFSVAIAIFEKKLTAEQLQMADIY